MAIRTIDDLPFAEVWAFDFEFFGTENGDRPTVVCLVARELRTGRIIHRWEDELGPDLTGSTVRHCLLASSAMPNAAVTSAAAGQCRRGSSTCRPNSAIS
jgi:hypothetical protein